jgi:hypothetical protein
LQLNDRFAREIDDGETMQRSGNGVGFASPVHDHGPDPREYFEQAGADATGSPEKRLLLAVLLNAITHLRRGHTSPAGAEAAGWVRGEVDAMHASFSFVAICETLDLDAEELSRALLGPAGPIPLRRRLPRRQVRTQRLRGEPRRYRPRVAAGR